IRRRARHVRTSSVDGPMVPDSPSDGKGAGRARARNVLGAGPSKPWYESTVEACPNRHGPGLLSRLSSKPEGNMKRVALVLCIIAVVACPALAHAQKAKTKNPEPEWDPKTVKTFKVVVMGVTASRTGELAFLRVKDDGGEHLVMLGPKASLDPALARMPASTEAEITASVVRRGKKSRELLLASVAKGKDKGYRL